ncbi:MAG TPA: class I adenylate-forming enzyme family protein [Candidatus Acidoferrum sp.]|jgi:acyl-CoA synthetase (AMP-forming)/AMP-acid ligase II
MIETPVPDILKTLPPRIIDLMTPWAAKTPDHPALVETGGTWTYGQLAEVIEGTKSWLQKSGVRPGDRVVIVFENCRAFVAILLASASLDAWPVLINARLSGREIDQIIQHCGARIVIYTTEVSSHAAEHAQRHGAVSANVPKLGLLALGPLNETAVPESIDPDLANRVAALIYTSGTTGLPKGVMLTHRNLLFIAAVSVRIRSVTKDDRLLGILPMSHAVGLSVVLLGTLFCGGTLYLSPRFDPMTVRGILEKHKITIALGVPAMFIQFLDYARLRGLKTVHFPDLRIISSSGAPLHPATKSAVEVLFGLFLHNGYGVTECSPTIATARLDDPPRTDTSVGRVLPGVEVKFMGADQKPVPEGEVGELWVRGPNIMKGYYRAPEETAAAINSEGWFNTRDLARLENGHLFIVGRTKELIVRFGFNVYPAEVEAVLNSHPSIARSAVIGRTVKGDEEVVAFIEPALDSSLTTAEVAEWVSNNLAPYKRPSQIIFVESMPVTLTGKVRKDELAKIVSSKGQLF